MQSQDIKNLKFRYLLWLYKTIKEDLDRIERKFTQLDIDKEVFQRIVKQADSLDSKDKKSLGKSLQEFKEYIKKKEKDAQDLKFDGQRLRPQYHFLLLKLKAVEKTIIQQLGQKAKDRIKTLYECEMQRRILESREHS
jgi:hypothetical protein